MPRQSSEAHLKVVALSGAGNPFQPKSIAGIYFLEGVGKNSRPQGSHLQFLISIVLLTRQLKFEDLTPVLDPSPTSEYIF